MKESKIENRILKDLVLDVSSRISKSVDGVSRVNEVKCDSDDETDEFIIDTYIDVKYGYRIPQVAWDVQNAVSKAIASFTDRNVKTVNIHIDGVNPD